MIIFAAMHLSRTINHGVDLLVRTLEVYQRYSYQEDGWFRLRFRLNILLGIVVVIVIGNQYYSPDRQALKVKCIGTHILYHEPGYGCTYAW
jgi:hypothetical protein